MGIQVDCRQRFLGGMHYAVCVSVLIRLAKQWVAGENLEAAIARSKEANTKGIGALINILGENCEVKSEVEETTRLYLQLLDRIAVEELDACISIKPSQFGLGFDPRLCERSLDAVLEGAMRKGGTLWMDMEDSRFTDATIHLYDHLGSRYEKVGICLQANLKRTEDDLKNLLSRRGRIRLTKGAYREDAKIAYRRKLDVDASFRQLLRLLFEQGDNFALATHDSAMIDEAVRLSNEHEKAFEFQMLMGVRDSLKLELVSRDYRVVEYIPFGPRWLPYFSRRLRERPRNVLTMIRSMVSG